MMSFANSLIGINLPEFNPFQSSVSVTASNETDSLIPQFFYDMTVASNTSSVSVNHDIKMIDSWINSKTTMYPFGNGFLSMLYEPYQQRQSLDAYEGYKVAEQALLQFHNDWNKYIANRRKSYLNYLNDVESGEDGV